MSVAVCFRYHSYDGVLRSYLTYNVGDDYKATDAKGLITSIRARQPSVLCKSCTSLIASIVVLLPLSNTCQMVPTPGVMALVMRLGISWFKMT